MSETPNALEVEGVSPSIPEEGTSTWSVLQPDGTVTHMPDAPTDQNLRRVLGGYRPSPVALISAVSKRMEVWRAHVPEWSTNFPALSLLNGLVIGSANLNGPVAFCGVDGEGLPSDVLARLEAFNERASGTMTHLLTAEDWESVK